jgi:hypothetical protein
LEEFNIVVDIDGCRVIFRLKGFQNVEDPAGHKFTVTVFTKVLDLLLMEFLVINPFQELKCLCRFVFSA